MNLVCSKIEVKSVVLLLILLLRGLLRHLIGRVSSVIHLSLHLLRLLALHGHLLLIGHLLLHHKLLLLHGVLLGVAHARVGHKSSVKIKLKVNKNLLGFRLSFRLLALVCSERVFLDLNIWHLWLLGRRLDRYLREDVIANSFNVLILGLIRLGRRSC